MLTTVLLVVLLAVSVWTLYRLHVLGAEIEAMARFVVSADETLIDVHKLLVALDRDLRE